MQAGRGKIEGVIIKNQNQINVMKLTPTSFNSFIKRLFYGSHIKCRVKSVIIAMLITCSQTIQLFS